MKTYIISDKTSAQRFARSFVNGLNKPLNDTQKYFKTLGLLIDTDVQNQFRSEGASGGYRNIPQEYNWQPLRSKPGTPRPGTDGKKTRVYTANSKPLQASGLFRKSFGIKTVSKDKLEYGTNHDLRAEIGRRPYRPVLLVTDKDRERYQKKFKTFIRHGIKFE